MRRSKRTLGSRRGAIRLSHRDPKRVAELTRAIEEFEKDSTTKRKDLHGEERALSEQVLEGLRALGYLQ